MRKVAIIPARGGSKRLPRKNILPLGCKPFIQWVVEACRESRVFDEIIVSTEDHEIANLAKNIGASVHEREKSLSQDTSTVVQVCEAVLKVTECRDFCCVYATSAFIKPVTLRESAKYFEESLDANVLMGVSKFNYAPVQALRIDSSGFASLLFPEYSKVQSQRYPEVRVSNGSFYWGRKEPFFHEKTFYSERLKVFEVPDNEVCDIDTEEDYLKAKARFERENSL